MMLGFLLARAGVETVVLEKHKDFLRDFRGDTIHPSTLEFMHELGLLDEFLRQPHQEAREVSADISGEAVPVADFSLLPTRCKFLAFMPQWDFLNFLAEHARRLPAFTLKTEAEVVDLLTENGRVTGVRIRTPEGESETRADLVVGCDGRHATTRAKSGLPVIDLGAPMDVLWMRVGKGAEHGGAKSLGHVAPGRLLFTIDRDDYWQCGFVIAKGTADVVRARGLPALREDMVRLAPFLRERIAADLDTWDKVKLLTVSVDRLACWHRPGLLLIGDAAHTMSPVGGVGINLAIQDAVAAANLLAGPLREKRDPVADEHLRAVQRRRELPTRLVQGAQVFLHKRVISKVLNDADKDRRLAVPWPLRLLGRWPWLRRFPARAIGLGFRPEHIRSAALTRPR